MLTTLSWFLFITKKKEAEEMIMLCLELIYE